LRNLLAVVLPLMLLARAATGGDNAEQIAFYNVALTCSSAPKLGCGSRAKRVLASLTADKRVAAAWVNEAGTRLAVQWMQPTAALTADQLNDILGPHALAVNPIEEATRAQLIASFRTNRGWFDSGSIDELSRKESAVIAERLVRRLAKRRPVSETQSTTLMKAIMKACWDREGCQLEQDITSIAQQAKLDRSAVGALRKVVALGYGPLENEQ